MKKRKKVIMSKRKKVIMMTSIFVAFLSVIIAIPVVLKYNTSKKESKENSFKKNKAIVNAITSSALSLPFGSTAFLPSQKSQPEAGLTKTQVNYIFTKWTQNDAIGTISWTVALTKGEAKRKLIGTINGFLTTSKKAILNNKNRYFPSFNQILTNTPSAISDGAILETDLEALDGHKAIPKVTGDVVRTFSISTNHNTGIAIVVVSLVAESERDTISYQISGFKTIINLSSKEKKALEQAQEESKQKIIEAFSKIKRHVDLELAQNVWNDLVTLKNNALNTIDNFRIIAKIQEYQLNAIREITRLGDAYHQKLIIDFNAKMKGKSSNNYRNQILASGFTIPKGITIIPYQAFYGTTFPKNFHFPSSLIQVKGLAFKETVFKSDPKLPSNVILDDYSFSHTTIPLGFKVPSDITITDNTFSSMNIPIWHRWTTSGGKYLKSKQPQLGTTLTKPSINKIKFVNIDEFAYQTLPSDFVIPSGVIEILEGAFMDAKLPLNFQLPNNLQIIGNSAFRNATIQKGFSLNNCAQLEIIDNYAFAEVILPASFRLPKTLKQINLFAFKSTTINSGFELPANINLDSGIFDSANLPNDFQIPKQVSLVKNTFKNAKLPLWSLWYKQKNGKDKWFSNKWVIENWSELQNDNLNLIKGAVIRKHPDNLKEIVAFEFTNREDLPEDFALPVGITKIKEGAFRGAKLPDTFILPQLVTTIEKEAFARTTIGKSFTLNANMTLFDGAFKSAKLPDGFIIPKTTTLNDNPFEKVKLSLWSRWYNDDNEKHYYKWFSNDRLSSELTKQKTEKPTLGFTIKGSVIKKQDNPTFIDVGEFKNKKLNEYFEIPNTVTIILQNAFFNANLPVGFVLPSSVIEIRGFAFFGAVLPNDFQIPASVKKIEKNAFLNAKLKNGKTFKVPARP